MHPPTPPAGYSARTVSMEDLPSVLLLMHACDLHDWGAADTMEAQLAYEWRMPDVDLSRDVWLVHADVGDLVGYAWILGRDEHRRLDGWGAVHPEHRGRGLGRYLMELRRNLEEVHAALAPPAVRVASYLGTVGPDRGAHQLAERFGYREVRHFWQMVIDLPTEEAISESRWPEGIIIRTFDRERDERAVHAAMQEAFAEHWGFVYVPFEEWAARMEFEWFDPSLWFLAEDGGELAGALLGAVLEGDGWVMTLGVRTPWRGRGIGEALLLESFAEFRRRGLAVVKLDVDAGNETGATRLYERVGMRVDRRYDDHERIVREATG
jgi:mycothiol synthase